MSHNWSMDCVSGSAETSSDTILLKTEMVLDGRTNHILKKKKKKKKRSQCQQGRLYDTCPAPFWVLHPIQLPRPNVAIVVCLNHSYFHSFTCHNFCIMLTLCDLSVTTVHNSASTFVSVKPLNIFDRNLGHLQPCL